VRDDAPKKETLVLEDPTGITRAEVAVFNQDPWFVVPIASTEEYERVQVDRDWTIIWKDTNERRPVVSVAVEHTFISVALKILAPRLVEPANSEAPYVKFAALDDMTGEKEPVELRPGTMFLGGRGSGFYDDFGLIIEARHIGGSPDRFEDWAYYVLGPSDFDRLVPQWILLDHIHSPVAGPAFLRGFAMALDADVEALLANGERELFEYFTVHRDKLSDISPDQFERLVDAIYRNLGFVTERVGAWNQADGGVDIIALSKTTAGTPFRAAIQCKASQNKISARPIRELAGVLDTVKAHQGIVATTSKFTAAAKAEAEGHLWKMSLQDADALYKRIVAILLPDANIRL